MYNSYKSTTIIRTRKQIIQLKIGRGPEQILFPRRHTNSQQICKKVLNFTRYNRNANQNHSETPHHMSEWLLSIRQKITSFRKDVQKKEPSLFWGTQMFLKKIKNWATVWPSHPPLGIYLKYLRTYSYISKDTGTPMLIAAVFTVTKTWEQPKCPPVDDWIKMCPMGTTGYCSATRKDEILPFVTTWRDLESHHAKWNKSDGKGQEPYDFTGKCVSKQKSIKNKQN